MNLRRLVLDVDKAIARPTLIDMAEAIERVAGVEGFNITVTEIDVETVGTNIIGCKRDVYLSGKAVLQVPKEVQVLEEESIVLTQYR
jgi:hypothetical protein